MQTVCTQLCGNAKYMSELNMWKYKQGGEMVVDDNEAQRVENEIKGAKPANAIKDVRNRETGRNLQFL